MLVVVSGYSAWPILSVHEFARDVRAGNAAAVTWRIDFGELRRSLSAQIVHTYMRITGVKIDPRLQDLSAAFGATIADPLVAKFISSELITELLQSGWPAPVLGEKPADVPDISAAMLNNALTLYLNSEYGFGEFRLWLPPDEPRTKQYRVQFTLHNWSWKLSSLLLPEHVRELLARELIRERERQAETP